MKHSIHHHTLSKEQVQHLLSLQNRHVRILNLYADQLAWWNKRINLLSRDVSRETIRHHIFHSLVISLSKSYNESLIIVDAGTGGGLPGIPLAATSPEKTFLLNDIVSKKITAVKQILRHLEINNALGIAGSIGDIDHDEPFTLISKHAFKIPDLLELVSDKKWDAMILLKGLSDVERELAPVIQSLIVDITALDNIDQTGFFDGKALVEIRKNE